MELKKIDYNFSICQTKDFSLVDLSDEYCFVGKTDEENSVVCITEKCPSNVLKRDDGWKMFRVQGTLDFSLIGVLSSIAHLLALNEISIFAISTFNTDYILVKEDSYEKTLQLLSDSGYKIV